MNIEKYFSKESSWLFFFFCNTNFQDDKPLQNFKILALYFDLIP